VFLFQPPTPHELHVTTTAAHTHVLLDEVQAAVHGHEGGNLLAILDQLDTRALTDSRVGLLGLNAAACDKQRTHTDTQQIALIRGYHDCPQHAAFNMAAACASGAASSPHEPR
jgi:hypothetical protein